MNPRELPVSEPIPFSLGPLRDTHPFLLSSSALVHLLGRDFLDKHHARIYLSPKGKIMLKAKLRKDFITRQFSVTEPLSRKKSQK